MTGSRIVIDGATYLVVQRRDLCNVFDEAARREIVLACLHDLSGRSAARRLVEELTGGFMLGTSDIARELDRLLENGRLVAVRERGSVRLLDAPRAYDPAWGRGDPREPGDPGDPGDPRRPVVPPPSRPGRPHGPDEPVVETTWIEVHLVDDDGTPVAGERLAIRFPDGSETQGYLDGDGRWRLDGIPAGTYQVCFPDVEDVWRPARRDPPETKPEIHRCARAGHRYAKGEVLPSLVSHPAGVDLIAALAALDRHLEASPSQVLTIVGRRDPGEPADRPRDALRAQAVIALLRNDRDAWVDVATKGGSYAEVQRLLSEISDVTGWPCDPGPRDGIETPRSHDAVEAFQQAYKDAGFGDILVDGVCGQQTLGAIFDVMRRELVDTARSCSLALDRPRFAVAQDGGIATASLPGDGGPCDPSGATVELIAAAPGLLDPFRSPPVPATALAHPIAPIEVRVGPAGGGDRLALVLLDRRGHRMPATGYVARFGHAAPIEGISDDRGVALLQLPRVCAETVDIAWSPTDDDLRFRYARRIAIDCMQAPQGARAQSLLRNLGYVPEPLEDAVWHFQVAAGVDHAPRPRGLVGDQIPPDTLAALERRLREIIES